MNGADDRNKGKKEKKKKINRFFWQTNVLIFFKMFNLNTFICENVELLEIQLNENFEIR